MKIEEFEKIMQREDREEKQEDLEKYGIVKVNGFLKEQKKNKKIFRIDLFLK